MVTTNFVVSVFCLHAFPVYLYIIFLILIKSTVSSLRKAEKYLYVVFSVIIKSELFLNRDRGAHILVEVVIEGVEISNLHYCMICMF